MRRCYSCGKHLLWFQVNEREIIDEEKEKALRYARKITMNARYGISILDTNTIPAILNDAFPPALMIKPFCTECSVLEELT